MYDPNSLTCQRALGGEVIESSTNAAWRSTLLERKRWGSGSHEVQGTATSDIRLSISQGRAHLLELRTADGWTSVDVDAGAMSITAPGEVDQLRWRANGPINSVSMYISEEVMDFAREELRRPGGSPVPTPVELMFRDPVILATVIALFEGLRSGAQDLYAEQAVTWLAMRLLHHHAGPTNIVSPRTESLSDQRLKRVTDLIQVRLAEPLSLDDLSREACISKFHFVRLFKIRTGLTPHAYLREQRMKAARKMLSSTELDIAAVGRNVGYEHSTPFGVAFRKAHGMAPGEYRRRSRVDKA